MKKIKIGYLPLYIKLYDDATPHYRDPMVEYMEKLIAQLEDCGFEVVCMPVCRIREEFAAAADRLNAEEVAAVVTQHLAYSPSLEGIDALLALKAPIVIMDTTMDFELIAAAGTENRIAANHGIHGVQDMCNLLVRNGKPFTLCVGHLLKNDVIGQVRRACRAAALAQNLRNAKVGTAGGVFDGMGDFQLEQRQFEQLGIRVREIEPERAAEYVRQVTEEEIEKEMAADRENYTVEAPDTPEYRASVRAGLAVRRWMQEDELTACTMNFLHIERSGLPKMPFVECCKILERGQGYAGEGDALTAALTGALFAIYPDTTFTEIFCPDWERDVLLLSHMGESNPRLAKWRPVLKDLEFAYNCTGDTTALYTCLRPGKAVLINLAPQREGFRLILSEVEMLDEGLEYGAYRYANQGWMRPCKPLPEFLKEYSLYGGTHHSALVYGGDIEELSCFGKMMGFEVKVIR